MGLIKLAGLGSVLIGAGKTLMKNNILRNATIGTGIGAVSGAANSQSGNRISGALKGGLIGGAVGGIGTSSTNMAKTYMTQPEKYKSLIGAAKKQWKGQGGILPTVTNAFNQFK